MAVILPMPGNEAMATALAAHGAGELGALETRRFPDEESYVRLVSGVQGRDVDIVCTLARPDAQLVSLVFAAETARELGATSVRLIAPYLAYMRQDARFKEGEAVSARHFARLISRSFDALVTVDPHLHRHRDLGEIYTIHTRVVSAAPVMADWIRANVENPLVVGPDSESEQWVSAVAQAAGAPHVVLSKRRLGDRDVEIAAPPLDPWKSRRPVLIDDVASTGRTMIEAVRQLLSQGMAKPYCLVVHALFSGDSDVQLSEACERLASTDTVPHASNAMTVAGLIAHQSVI